MTLAYEIDGPILHFRFAGDTSLAEIEAVWDAAVRDPRWTDRRGALADIRRSTSLPARSPAQIEQLVRFVVERRGAIRGRLAAVVGRPVQFGLMRMAQALSSTSGLELRPFWTEEDARAWLLDRPPCR